jgi:hypothetical protein
MTEEQEVKVRENRLRRAAERQGLRLVKSRRRDPRAFDYGKYMLVDSESNAIVHGLVAGHIGAGLDDIEAYLNQ